MEGKNFVKKLEHHLNMLGHIIQLNIQNGKI